MRLDGDIGTHFLKDSGSGITNSDVSESCKASIGSSKHGRLPTDTF